MGKFANKPSHKTSKRQLASKKHKIDKRVKEHNKKMKKESKKLKSMGLIKKKSTQNVDLPNSFPFKKNVLDQLERKKKEKEIEKLQKQLGKKKLSEEIQIEETTKTLVFEENELQALAEENKLLSQGVNIPNGITIEKQKVKYYKEIKKVIEASDVVLEVLDARDPKSCRSIVFEKVAENQKVIALLNKIDLVPSSNAASWKASLEKEISTLLFKNLNQDKVTVDNSLNALQLLQYIQEQFKNVQNKEAITIGIVGYPNVGKQSVLNALKQEVANYQGTPAIKFVSFTGVLLDDKTNKSSDSLRNELLPESMSDPVTPVASIIKRIPKDSLLLLYKIADFKNTSEFLNNVSKAKGMFKKGGVSNIEGAARAVVSDWCSGKLKYSTVAQN